MLNFLLCDDNSKSLQKFSQMLELTFENNELDGKICFTSTTGQEALEYVKSNTVDVVILDIDLNSSYNGLQLANDIRSINKSIYIIFATAYIEFAIHAFKLKTFDYLMKPITIKKIESAILRLFNDISSSPTQNFLKLNNDKIILNIDSINYIEKNRTQIIIKTDSNEYSFYSSFNKLTPNLPSSFVRCHKSYIVNINNIESIDNLTINFKNNTTQCYIGKKYKNNLMEVLTIEPNI